MSVDAGKVAAGLTKGERAGLIMAHPTQPMAFVALHGKIRVQMFFKGLLERAIEAEEDNDPLLFRLTPLGLAVRAILATTDAGTLRGEGREHG